VSEAIIIFYGEDAIKLGFRTQRFYEATDKDKKTFNRGKIFSVGDYTFAMVRKAERKYYKGKKYDLLIDGVHDYTVNGAIVHNSWNSIPFYGIQRAMGRLTELLASKQRYFEYVLLAHFHNTGVLQTNAGKIMISGSMIGGNEYSLNKMYMANKPEQTFFGVHKEHGVTWRYDIKL